MGSGCRIRWNFTSFFDPNPVVHFDKKGIYTATLTVTDPAGASNSASLSLVSGNEPPSVELELTGNTSFFFPETPFDYSVNVLDDEDGDTIDPSHIAISIDYVSEGFDYAEVIQGQRSVDATTRFAVAQALMSRSDCSVCHQVDVRSAGPSYKEIEEKYSKTPDVVDMLAEKIIAGGAGVWGEITMPAHPMISHNDAKNIASYILQVSDQTHGTLPMSGTYMPQVPKDDNGSGSVIVRAAYMDRGAGEIPPQSEENVVILGAASLMAGDADIIEGVRTSVSGRGAGPVNIIPSHGGFIVFEDVDVTGIKLAELAVQARTRDGSVGGAIEFRLGSPDGTLWGKTSVEATEFRFRRPPTATQIQEAGGNVNSPQNANNTQNQQQPEQRPANSQSAGQSSPAGQTGGGGFRRPQTSPTVIMLNEAAGKHDLFVVFKNPQARSIDPLFSLSRIDFKNTLKTNQIDE